MAVPRDRLRLRLRGSSPRQSCQSIATRVRAHEHGDAALPEARHGVDQRDSDNLHVARDRPASCVHRGRDALRGLLGLRDDLWTGVADSRRVRLADAAHLAHLSHRLQLVAVFNPCRQRVHEHRGWSCNRGLHRSWRNGMQFAGGGRGQPTIHGVLQRADGRKDDFCLRRVGRGLLAWSSGDHRHRGGRDLCRRRDHACDDRQGRAVCPARACAALHRHGPIRFFLDALHRMAAHLCPVRDCARDCLRDPVVPADDYECRDSECRGHNRYELRSDASRTVSHPVRCRSGDPASGPSDRRVDRRRRRALQSIPKHGHIRSTRLPDEARAHVWPRRRRQR